MSQYEVDVTIKGIAPMLQNKFGAEAMVDALETKRRAGEKDWTEEWRDKTYADADGNVYIPATWIEATLISAASSFRIKGSGRKTYKSLVQAAVYVSPDAISLNISIPKNPTHNPKDPFSIDLRPVRLNRARILRARPMIAEGWEATFTMTVIDDQLRPDVLKDILDEAGRAHGIGDYRPRFGRFMVTRYDECKNE